MTLSCSVLCFLPDVMALCAVVERTEALTESWVKKDVKQLGVVFVFFLISFVSLMQVVGRVEGVLLLCNAIVNGRTPSCASRLKTAHVLMRPHPRGEEVLVYPLYNAGVCTRKQISYGERAMQQMVNVEQVCFGYGEKLMTRLLNFALSDQRETNFP